MVEKTKTPIEPGSVVQMKSGGPYMTVESVTGSTAVCVWQDKSEKQQRATFSLVTLDNTADHNYSF